VSVRSPRAGLISVLIAVLALLLGSTVVADRAAPARAANLPFPSANGWTNPVPATYYNDWDFGLCTGNYVPGRSHLGADSQGVLSGSVKALAAGTVRSVIQWGTGWAMGVESLASDGTRFIAWYGHINPPSLAVGTTVSAGQVIASLWPQPDNNTHLHLGIRPLGPGESGSLTYAGYATCPNPQTGGWVSPIPWLQGHRPGTSLDQYVGNIVKWRNADGSNTSWLVYGDRRRRWIPSTAVYSCLLNHGAVDKGAQTSGVLNQLPDITGSQAGCSPPARPTTGGVVSSGQGLDRGVTSSSGTGFYSLVQQTDGNLVLYKSGGRSIWANSANGPTAWTAMQSDGNLVAYDVIGRPRWSSNTAGNGASRLVVQDDGNAVIYRNSDGRAVWQSGTGGGRQPVAQPAGRTDRLGVNQGIWRGGAVLTSSDGRFQLILQASDGNMVIYKQGVAIWAIGGRDDDFLVNQGDGNVVIYRTHGGAVWSTGTGGQGGSTLVMQSDGNLVLYRGSDGRPIWSSGTAGR
jgi:hypothetical protein